MIPLNLKLRNFMCYREDVPPLSFAGIHTACLSGDNGNGKSALIDAMTWALWGKARAKSDDDLIHSNERDMEVEFDFTVGQQPYRVIRKRARPRRTGGQGQSILDFQLATGNGYRSIAGTSIAQTEQKIIDTLHMDYETFVNSAFLRQGHADEFTTRRPAERKEVLASILGLSYYDVLEEQARELARQQEMAKAQLESTLQEIAAELAQRPTYEAELEEAQRLLSQLEAMVQEKEANLNRLKQQKETLDKKKVQLEQLEASIGDRGRSLQLLEAQVEHHNSRIREYEEVIAQRTAIEEGYAQFMETRKLYDELDRKFRQSVSLERQKRELESKISEAGRELDREQARVQQSIADGEDKIQRFARKREEVQQLQSQYDRLKEQEEALQQKREACQELRTQVNHLESRQAHLEREIRELEEKLDLLASGAEARCPLCETELGAEGLKLIESKYNAERQSKAESLASTQDELAQKKRESESQQDELSRLETDLNQQRLDLQSRAAELNREAREAQESTRQRDAAKKRLAEIEQSLISKDFAAAEQEALTALEKGMAELAYDTARHEQVRKKLGELEQYDEPKRKLEEADRLINQEKGAASRAEAAAREIRRNLEEDNRKKQELASALEALPGLTEEVAAAQKEYETLGQQQKQAQELVWQAKARLQRCDELETRKKEREKQLSQAAKEEGIYRELARAFGKGGIQALLIETALPEIEIEANRLLGRMTDNRMHVKFETQRATKKGDVIETLDITISDELGTRNYEMFSGGEAFRINFAIRIALSRLLARRAGAPLPTLIIDEGFGTQDAAGIEKLKEAINSIQDDFEKILVITHIEELRDAFPTRIDVIKTAAGSTISVN